MQISTKVSTQVILSEAELKEAAIDFVKARTELPTDAVFDVSFEDDHIGDLTAVIDITGTTGSTSTTPSTTATDKPKTRRTKTEAAPAAEPEVKEEPAADPVAEAEEEPPFVPDGVDEPVKVEETKGPNPKGDEPQTEPKLEAKTTRIFPETGNSAPTLPVADADPVVRAKSLFANLNKPTN